MINSALNRILGFWGALWLAGLILCSAAFWSVSALGTGGWTEALIGLALAALVCFVLMVREAGRRRETGKAGEPGDDPARWAGAPGTRPARLGTGWAFWIIAVNMLFQILNVGRIAAEDIKEGQYVYSYVWVALVVFSVFAAVSYLRQERRKAGGDA